MKTIFAGIAFFLSSVLCAAEAPVANTIRSVDDVLRHASRREKVVVAGTVKKAFDFDTLVLVDNNAEIAVSFVGVRQDIRAGDKIVVAGRFDGRRSYRSSYGLIYAIDWALQDDKKVALLVERFGAAPARSAAPVSSPAPAASPTSESIETRLQQLETLKAKNLITPEEYQLHRQRILDDL